MFGFDQMNVQAEVAYRTERLRRGKPIRRRGKTRYAINEQEIIKRVR